MTLTERPLIVFKKYFFPCFTKYRETAFGHTHMKSFGHTHMKSFEHTQYMSLRKRKTVLPSNIFAVSKRPHKTLRKRSFFHKKIIFLDVLSDVSKRPYMMQKERSFVKEKTIFHIVSLSHSQCFKTTTYASKKTHTRLCDTCN